MRDKERISSNFMLMMSSSVAASPTVNPKERISLTVWINQPTFQPPCFNSIYPQSCIIEIPRPQDIVICLFEEKIIGFTTEINVISSE